jgi:predicted metal-dependent hydrolase
MDREGFVRGIELFNRGEFFKAHEVLEDVWRAAPVPEKKFLQGIIQIAVALHHHSTGNPLGARSLMKRGAKNLSTYSGDFGGIRLDRLLGAVHRWEEAITEHAASPPMPQVEMHDK